MYTICSLITCLITHKANKGIVSKYKVNRKIGMFLLVIVAMIFAILAALRDYNIGTDINYYVIPIFNSAKTNNFETYWNSNNTIIEPLYLLLNYIVSSISSNPHLLMGIISFIISLLVILRLADYKEYKKMWIGVFIYNFALFPISLNLMRQSIAMAILFYSTRYIFTEKLKIRNFIFGTIIAMGFHLTGIMGFFLLIIELYYKKNFSQDSSISIKITSKTIILIVALIIVVLAFDKIVAVIVPLSQFTRKYSSYYTVRGKMDFNPLLVRLPFIILIFLKRKEFYRKDSENYLLFLFMVIDAITSLLRSYSGTLYRVSIYFAYYKMLAIPNFTIIHKGKNKLFINVAVCIIFYLIWIYQIVIQGNEQVFPYTAKWIM